MLSPSISRLHELCHIIPPLLYALSEADMNEQPAPGKWSKKQILGHLIDSAANNHQRFVRGQFEDNPIIAYEQDKWNSYNYYPQIDSRQLIDLWTVYNKQLAILAALIPADLLDRTCATRDGQLHTIAFLFQDYVQHLEHHLRQIADY